MAGRRPALRAVRVGPPDAAPASPGHGRSKTCPTGCAGRATRRCPGFAGAWQVEDLPYGLCGSGRPTLPRLRRGMAGRRPALRAVRVGPPGAAPALPGHGRSKTCPTGCAGRTTRRCPGFAGAWQVEDLPYGLCGSGHPALPRLCRGMAGRRPALRAVRVGPPDAAPASPGHGRSKTCPTGCAGRTTRRCPASPGHGRSKTCPTGCAGRAARRCPGFAGAWQVEDLPYGRGDIRVGVQRYNGAMPDALPALSVSYPASGRSATTNAMGMRPCQERCWLRRGEQHLLLKSPPASGKSRALMFLAIDKVKRQGLKQAIVVVPEKTIGASFADEELTAYGFDHDWTVEPRWNLCNAPGDDEDAGGGQGRRGRGLPAERQREPRLHPRDLPLRGRPARRRGLRRPARRDRRVPPRLRQPGLAAWASTCGRCWSGTGPTWSR